MQVPVKWAICTADQINKDGAEVADALELAALAPTPLFSHLRETRKGLDHLECYALHEFCKNAFVVLSPIDLTISVNSETNFLTVQEFTEVAYKRLCHNRGKTDRGYSMTMPPSIVFYSSQDVVMESMGLSILKLPKDTSIFPGRYNISKWIRPVDWTFEIVNGATEVAVKRGDPLFVVRFFPPVGGNVELERVEYNKSLHKTVTACTGFKALNRKTPLAKLYDMGNEYITRFLSK
tara:strand:- start:328 stop:1035 length:708 start_codon:yes stop_codon:yes gene_type:complete